MKHIFTKSFFFVAVFMLSVIGLFAKPIDMHEAKNIAHQFLNSNLSGSKPEKMKRVLSQSSLTLAYEAKEKSGNSNLFVFNQGDNGFVVVAGDDCVSPVLGYADAGAFDVENMPEGFRYWLESCSCYIEKAAVGSLEQEKPTMVKTQERSYASYIEPLLGDIAFHQQEPYNDKCPTVYGERTIVGCVAISMGQIMTYYQWPKQGQGSYSYTTETESLNVSADFNTTYDWSNILHYYEDGNYSTTQKNAVAKMLFHCGVSVNMDYGVDGSGTSDLYVPKAMTEYFSYDKGMQLHYRAMYNFNDWKNIIKAELNDDRPIIYCGQSEEGGHAFNCDGYDVNDYFHINWGWGGYCNGYYDLRYLDYEDNEQSAYNRSHSIVTGIKPDKGDGTETQTELAHNLMLTNGANVTDNMFTYAVFNMGGGTFVGDIATGIYYEDELVYEYIHYSGVECAPGYGSSEVYQDISIWTMDYYEVQPIYRESGSSEWKPIPGENGMLSRWVYYNGNWTYYLKDIPQLQINSWNEVGDLTSSISPVFELNITNTNDFDYYGQIFLCIGDYNLNSYKTSILKQITILSGETQTIQIDFGTETFAEGDYYLSAWADMKNGDVEEMCNSDGEYMFPITIGQGSGSVTSEPQLELYNYSSLNKTEFTFGEELAYTAYIYNSGESGYVYLSIDAYNYAGERLGCIASYNDYYVNSGYNNIVLSGTLTEDLIAEGDYYVRIWWSYDNSYGHIEPDYYNAIAFSVKKEESYSYHFELVGDMQLNKTTFDRGETIEATYTIRNNGDGRYLNLGIAIADLYENTSYTNLDNTTQVYFPAYSEKEITSTIVVPSDFEYGEYRMLAYYYNDWDDIGYKFFIPIEFNAKHITIEEEIRQPQLEIVDPIQLNKTSFYPGETIEASFSLKNIGYDGYVNVGLTMTDNSSDLCHPELGDDMQNIYLSANSTKKLNFTIDIPRNYAVGSYSVIAYQEVGGLYYNINSTENSVVLISVEEHDGKYDIFVTSNSDGEVVGSGRYEYGSEVTIAAIPDYGYKFYRWSDKNKENPRVVTVDGEATYEAEFRAITLSLEAQPNDDAFEFVEWSDGVTDNPRTISIGEESELKYVAIFRMKETAVENAYITSAYVYSNSGNLYVVGAESDYLVFDEVGKLIYSGNENSIQLPSGAYLVRLGEEVQKVIVK